MTLFDIPLWQLAIAWGVTFLGALIQGSVGFGLAVISAPVLLMIAPEFVPGSLMTSALVLCSLIAFREREAIVPSEVAVSSVARLAATIPTAMLVGVIDQRAFSMIFAVAVLAAVGVSMSPYRLPFTHRNLAIASAISGITNTLTAIGGPPMALVYQGQKGSHLRATMSAIFTIGTLFSIVSLSVVGKFHGRDIVPWPATAARHPQRFCPLSLHHPLARPTSDPPRRAWRGCTVGNRHSGASVVVVSLPQCQKNGVNAIWVKAIWTLAT